MKILLIITILLSIHRLTAQQDSSWTVLLLKKGNTLEYKEDMMSHSNSGFYLFRNCNYELTLEDGSASTRRLIDIKQDTLYLTNYFNANVAKKNKESLDTIPFHFSELAKLNVISDRALGIYTTINLNQYEFIFSKENNNYSLSSEWLPIYQNDTASYEIAPHLTAQGVEYLFEENGRTYYYYGPGMIKPNPADIDTTYDKRNILWFTPCQVEKINGVAIGMYSENIKNDYYNEEDSLQINGINLEINFMLLAMLPYLSFTGPNPDSLEYYDANYSQQTELVVNGLNLSFVGTHNEAILNGMSVCGVNTLVDQINGFSLSGLSNFSYKMKGLTIAGIRNRATEAKGIQIALLNKATQMKGFQIGLWNTNGKRSLPLINWQFNS